MFVVNMENKEDYQKCVKCGQNKIDHLEKCRNCGYWTRWQKIRWFIRECRRVLKITKKPDTIEFKTIVKVAGLGILIIGLIGFIVQMIKLVLFD